MQKKKKVKTLEHSHLGRWEGVEESLFELERTLCTGAWGWAGSDQGLIVVHRRRQRRLQSCVPVLGHEGTDCSRDRRVLVLIVLEMKTILKLYFN